MIRISTQRFGTVQRDENELIHFPCGIFGFELHRDWLLLGDREHGALHWLQSIEESELALAVVDPREFLADYSLHANRTSLVNLWNGTEPLIVLSVLTEYQQRLCLDLRNPIVINAGRRSGRQIVCTDNRPLQYTLPEQPVPLRQSA